MKRTFTRLLGAIALSATLFPMVAASADDYPSGTIKIIEAFAPGGSTDFMSRYLAARVSAAWKQPVVVENRPGAAGQIGTASVIKAKPDGYTLLTLPNEIWSVGSLLYKLAYDMDRDLVPIAAVARVPMVMVVHPAVPANDLQDFIRYAKAHPGQIAYGSAGDGTLHHLSGELFKLMAQVDMVHVPYRGTTPAIADLVGGQIQLVFSPISAILPHIKAGKLKVIGVAGATRVAALPGVPTLSESGLPGYTSDLWITLIAPAGTPRTVIDAWSTQLKTIINTDETRNTLALHGIEPAFDTSDNVRRRFAEDTARWRRVIEQARIRLN